jgi:glyoxylase-like metal-dependent hydrolase (beta-lactamase superfamily II)
VGPLQCNCIILGCEKSREAVVIDPGDEADRIIARLQEADYQVKYLLHTHAHFDHFAATGKVKEVVGGTVCLHRDDEVLFKQLPMQGRMFGFDFDPAPSVEKFLSDEEVLRFGSHRLEVLHTPGHSPGGLSFKLLDTAEAWLFAGDTLFRESIGRTDLWGGDTDTLIRSIKRRLFTLDDQTEVIPGHGPQTQIGWEKRHNPFLV